MDPEVSRHLHAIFDPTIKHLRRSALQTRHSATRRPKALGEAITANDVALEAALHANPAAIAVLYAWDTRDQ